MKETTEKNENFLKIAVEIFLHAQDRNKVIRDRTHRKKKKAKAVRMEDGRNRMTERKA
jgi:hypothetical protein